MEIRRRRMRFRRANAIPRKKRAYAIRPYGAGVIRWVHRGRMRYARTALALFGGSMEGVCDTPVQRWHYSVGPWRAYAIRPYEASIIQLRIRIRRSRIQSTPTTLL